MSTSQSKIWRVAYILPIGVAFLCSVLVACIDGPVVFYQGIQVGEFRPSFDPINERFELKTENSAVIAGADSMFVTQHIDEEQIIPGAYYIGSFYDGWVYWSRIDVKSEGATTTIYVLGQTEHLSMWVPALLFGLWLALLVVVPLCRRMYRRYHTLCIQCGYDVRESPGGCPECGTSTVGKS